MKYQTSAGVPLRASRSEEEEAPIPFVSPDLNLALVGTSVVYFRYVRRMSISSPAALDRLAFGISSASTM